jgi:hypothetical protein
MFSNLYMFATLVFFVQANGQLRNLLLYKINNYIYIYIYTLPLNKYLVCLICSSPLEPNGLTSLFFGPRLVHFRNQIVDTSCPTCLKLQRPCGSSGLERIGIAPCGREVPKCIWLERARARGQETLERLPLYASVFSVLSGPVLIIIVSVSFDHYNGEASD